jgi:hypothetical protein
MIIECETASIDDGHAVPHRDLVQCIPVMKCRYNLPSQNGLFENESEIPRF